MLSSRGPSAPTRLRAGAILAHMPPAAAGVRRSRARVGASAAAAGVLLLTASPVRPAPQAASPPASSRQEAVAQRACSGCHALPSPDILPRHSWRAVVVDMTALIL